MSETSSVIPGRRDYYGKGWLQKNSSHIGSLLIIIFLFCVYVLLPLLDKPVPHIDAEAWLVVGAIIGVQKWKSGNADIAANTRFENPRPSTPPIPAPAP